MTEFKKTNHVLPDSVVAAFQAIGTDTKTRDLYISELRSAQWTHQSIAAAAGITRERVRQIIESVPSDEPTGYVIPEPPRKPVKAPVTYVEPSADTLARLLALKPLAEQVRSNSPKFRKEAEEYTRLINHAHTVEGVTLYRLAKRLGVTHGALRFRLARYGYKSVEGKSKVYTPINPENRAD
jgi:hypothetical protein